LPASVTWVSSTDTNVVGATATKSTTFTATPLFIRVLLNSGSGSVTSTVVQAGVAPY